MCFDVDDDLDALAALWHFCVKEHVERDPTFAEHTVLCLKPTNIFRGSPTLAIRLAGCDGNGADLRFAIDTMILDFFKTDIVELRHDTLHDGRKHLAVAEHGFRLLVIRRIFFRIRCNLRVSAPLLSSHANTSRASYLYCIDGATFFQAKIFMTMP